VAGAESGWDELVHGLVQVLPTLSDRAFLLLSSADVPTVYVQFAQTPAELVVHTGADDVLPPEHRLGEVGAERMRGLGWREPGSDPQGGRSWHTAAAWPARTAEYERLARMCVAVLRHVHQVPSPDALEYKAWREAEPPPEGVTFYTDELEPLEPHLEFPALPVRDAAAG
jgi:hypothetical protein